MIPCVILAGGLGTRMWPATRRLPKSLLPVLGRPFAELQLEWLAQQGITHVLYCTGYRGDMVSSALGDGSRFGVALSYSDEGNARLGTGGALRLALDRAVLPETFFVLNGDSYLTLDLQDVQRAWTAANVPILMTVLQNRDSWDRSNVAFTAGRVVYDKARSPRNGPFEWIDYGLSVFRREVIAKNVQPGVATDLADVVHDMSCQGCVAGYAVDERFYEMGSAEGLRDLEAHLSARAAARASDAE